MTLHIEVMEKENSVSSCLMFQDDETTPYWKEPLFNVYPFLDRNIGLNSSWEKRREYLTQELSAYYSQIKDELDEKAKIFNKHWAYKEENVIKIFSKVFNIDCNSIFNNMAAEISINPICPRDLKEKSFTIFYKSDESRFLETTLHESIHFVWFYLWQNYFKDNIEEYEGPHLKWVLSEMVVDTFVNHSDIGKLFSKESRSSAVYKYFYTMNVCNEPILDTLAKFYKKAKSIKEFMEISYKYCQDNEEKIRKQML